MAQTDAAEPTLPATKNGFGSDQARSGRALWQGVRTAVHFSNAFQTLRSMAAESYVDPAHLTTIKRLGEGAFATVDLCWYSPPSEGQKVQVAVKRMKPEIFSQPADLAAFLREADLLRKIRHSYIVEYIGVGAMDISTPESVQASTYLVQEYMAAGTLKRVVFKRQLATSRTSAYRLQDALRWCTQVARALRYLHGAKPMIIHRDLKLENILLHGPSAAMMVAKVADFGLCACVDSWISARRAVESDNMALVGSLRLINSGATVVNTPTKPAVLRAAPTAATDAADGAARTASATTDKVEEPLPSPFMGTPPANEAATNGTAQQTPAAATPAAAPEAAEDVVLQLRSSKPLEVAAKPIQAQPVTRPSSLKRVLTSMRDSRKHREQLPGTQTFRLSGHTGSLLYMAPEVYKMEEYNHKVDVFSFGVLMLELFSGRVLSTVVAPNGFFSEIDAYAHKVAMEGYRPSIPPSVPAPVAQLIQRCWAQPAADRPDMDEVVKALQGIEASGVVHDVDAAEAAPTCRCFG